MQPMQEFRLLTLSRRRRLVQATSVRVEVASGPATLTFFTDQTEAARAQEACVAPKACCPISSRPAPTPSP